LVIDNKSHLPVLFEEMELSYDSLKRSFLEQINRGGLKRPSDQLYICGLHAMNLFLQIKKKSDVMQSLLKSSNPRGVFVKCFLITMDSHIETNSLLTLSCQNNHSFKKFMEETAGRLFNFFGKNFAADVNSNIHESKLTKSKMYKKSLKDSRKISKLSSK
jgi:hypothetical protein